MRVIGPASINITYSNTVIINHLIVVGLFDNEFEAELLDHVK